MTKVKICGLKTLADINIVNRYLPEYVGFVFAKTKRFVTDEQALIMRKCWINAFRRWAFSLMSH